MKAFIIEACIAIPIALLVCYALAGLHGVIGSIIGLGFTAIDYRKKYDAEHH